MRLSIGMLYLVKSLMALKGQLRKTTDSQPNPLIGSYTSIPLF